MPRVQASCSAKWRRTRARARKAIPKPAVTPSYRRLLTRRPSSSRWQMLADLKPDEFEAKAWRAGRSAHCRAQAAAVLALEHKDGSLRGHWGGHLSRASAIAVRICDENSALAPDTAPLVMRDQVVAPRDYLRAGYPQPWRALPARPSHAAVHPHEAPCPSPIVRPESARRGG